MKRYKCQALVSLYPASHGGLAEALPSETRCLVVRAAHPETRDERLFSSVVRTDDGQALRPGSCALVTMQVNGDDAREFVVAGEAFTLWFRTNVGRGVVSRRIFT